MAQPMCRAIQRARSSSSIEGIGSCDPSASHPCYENLLVSLGPASRTLDEVDTQLYLRWIKLVSQPIEGTQIVFHPFKETSGNEEATARWLALLRSACRHSLRFLAAAAANRVAQPPATATGRSALDLEILAFLGLLTVVDAKSPAATISVPEQHRTLAASLLALLLVLGLHRTLRIHILSFTLQQKTSAPSLSPALSFHWPLCTHSRPSHLLLLLSFLQLRKALPSEMPLTSMMKHPSQMDLPYAKELSVPSPSKL